MVKMYLLAKQLQEQEMILVVGNLAVFLNVRAGRKIQMLIRILLLKLLFGKIFVMLLGSRNGKRILITQHRSRDYLDLMRSSGPSKSGQ